MAVYKRVSEFNNMERYLSPMNVDVRMSHNNTSTVLNVGDVRGYKLHREHNGCGNKITLELYVGGLLQLVTYAWMEDEKDCIIDVQPARIGITLSDSKQ